MLEILFVVFQDSLPICLHVLFSKPQKFLVFLAALHLPPVLFRDIEEEVPILLLLYL